MIITSKHWKDTILKNIQILKRIKKGNSPDKNYWVECYSEMIKSELIYYRKAKYNENIHN